MDAHPGPGAAPLSATPARPRDERTRLRPSIFGIAVGLVVVVAAVVRPPVADPSVAGLVWAGLLGALLLGVLWPLVTVRSVGVRVVEAPTDLTTGQLATLRLELSGRAAGLSLGATGLGITVLDVVAPGAIDVPVSIVRRGAYHRIRITVGSDAPFGVATATRTRVVDLPRQLLVGPEPVPVDVQPGELPADHAEATPRGAGTSGESVRSVRPYVTGDPAHLVHWPSSARTGELVVRELESPTAKGLAVVVDLGPVPAGEVDDPATDPVELAARRAAGAASAALLLGARVVLCTAEASGPVAGEVVDRLAIQRRLALAVAGGPASAPEGWPVLRIAASQPVAATVGPAPVHAVSGAEP